MQNALSPPPIMLSVQLRVGTKCPEEELLPSNLLLLTASYLFANFKVLNEYRLPRIGDN